MAMKRMKAMPPQDEEPMTADDIRTVRNAIEGFDDVELIAPGIREVIEDYMPDLAERLPPEVDVVVQVQRRIEAKREVLSKRSKRAVARKG